MEKVAIIRQFVYEFIGVDFNITTHLSKSFQNRIFWPIKNEPNSIASSILRKILLAVIDTQPITNIDQNT